MPRPENQELYKQYKELADSTPNVHFVGRLATYRYYNMDQVTAQALTLYARMKGMSRTEAAQAGATPTLLTTIPATVVRAPEPRVPGSQVTCRQRTALIGDRPKKARFPTGAWLFVLRFRSTQRVCL